MSAKISVDEWRAELDRLARANARASDEGWTVKELCAATKHGQKFVCDQLRALPPGDLIVGRKAVIGLDGRHTYVPCYRVARRKAKRR